MVKNEKKYFATFYACPNTHFGCFYEFGNKHNLENHLAVCVDPKILRETTQSKSIEYSQVYNQIDNLIARGVLSKSPSYRNHIVYDVESLMTPLDRCTKNTESLFQHRLVSVACNGYINGEHESKCWVVNDDSDREQKRIVGEFLEYVLEQAELVEHGAELLTAIEKHGDCIETEENKLGNNGKDQNWSSPYLSQLRKDLKFMKKYLELPLVGFNSSRYDMKLLLKLMIEALEEQDQCGNLSLLKKGAGYFHVQTGGLVWKDLLNFIPPMKLDAFLKMWQTDAEKLCFPYEKFSSIRQLKDCKEFPTVDDFKTSLGNEVDTNLYRKCKQLFDGRIVLPVSDPNKWNSFVDYLCYYNICDVYPTSLAMNKMMILLEEHFGVNPLINYGLPSFGFASMMKSFPKDCPSVVSFPPEFNHLSNLFRRSIIGGIVNPICRHITTNQEENAAPAAKLNADGIPFKRIDFWDLNAMYPAGYKNDQPTGLGFEWSPNENGGFSKKLIKNSTASLEGIQWLDSLRNEPYLVDSNGERQVIRTAWFGSEVNVGTLNKPIDVDGHCVVDGKVYVYQYDGCSWHRCNKCDTPFIGNPEKIIEDIEKRKYLEDNFNLVHITSCEWYKKRNLITNPGISPLLHYKSVKEDVILDHILTNRIFGFCVIDLFPTAAAKKWELANWGPIIERTMVEHSMLPEWMKSSANEKNYPKETLTQTYHAEKYFCSTRLAQFYVENGYRITKLHSFIEFQPKPVLRNFYQKCYNLRVKATIENNPCLTAAAKNTANAPYGRCILNPHNFSDNSIVGNKQLVKLRKSSKYMEETRLTPTKTEVHLVKTQICERYPLQLGQSILMDSKLLLNQFVAFLMKYFDHKSFRLVYTGKKLLYIEPPRDDS